MNKIWNSLDNYCKTAVLGLVVFFCFIVCFEIFVVPKYREIEKKKDLQYIVDTVRVFHPGALVSPTKTNALFSWRGKVYEATFTFNNRAVKWNSVKELTEEERRILNP